MSSTMVLTMADPPQTTTHLQTTIPDPQTELRKAHARIADLETQVRLLNKKATAAVDRWADYEDELQKLRAEKGPPAPPPKEEGLLASGTNRLSALLSRNKSSPNLALESFERRPREPTRTQSQPGPDTEHLLREIKREKSLRKEAEGRVAATSVEVEELSASLFEQANEMVAEERRARAKLEERVDELERRDREKRKRLERLESAMGRIERVKKVLEETKP